MKDTIWWLAYYRCLVIANLSWVYLFWVAERNCEMFFQNYFKIRKFAYKFLHFSLVQIFAYCINNMWPIFTTNLRPICIDLAWLEARGCGGEDLSRFFLRKLKTYTSLQPSQFMKPFTGQLASLNSAREHVLDYFCIISKLWCCFCQLSSLEETVGNRERKMGALIASYLLFLLLVLNHFQGNFLDFQIIAKILS